MRSKCLPTRDSILLKKAAPKNLSCRTCYYCEQITVEGYLTDGIRYPFICRRTPIVHQRQIHRAPQDVWCGEYMERKPQCEIMEEDAEPQAHRATVSAGVRSAESLHSAIT